MKIMGLIVPCYNEGKVIDHSIQELNKVFDELIDLNLISRDSFMIFVDDGSRDNTWELLKKHSNQDPRVRSLRFSRNFGHQNALLAGYEYCSTRCDFNVCIDADLQHDIWSIKHFITKHEAGSEIVLGIKETRGDISVLKKITGPFFYHLMRIMGVQIVHNHADFRLLSTRVTKQLLEFQEVNLFLRGIIPMLGYNPETINYHVKDRFAGESKYSLRKLMELALNGITSMTITPLRFLSTLGLVVFLFSFLQLFYTIYHYMKGNVIPGWSSTVIPIYFLGGIQLMGMGIIGEYIGKIYLETKHRPKFLISEFAGNQYNPLKDGA